MATETYPNFYDSDILLYDTYFHNWWILDTGIPLFATVNHDNIPTGAIAVK